MTARLDKKRRTSHTPQPQAARLTHPSFHRRRVFDLPPSSFAVTVDRRCVQCGPLRFDEPCAGTP